MKYQAFDDKIWWDSLIHHWSELFFAQIELHQQIHLAIEIGRLLILEGNQLQTMFVSF